MATPKPRWWAEFVAPANFDPGDFDPTEFDATPIPVAVSTVDDDSDDVPHYGAIVADIALTSRASDAIWRTMEPQRATVELANATGQWTDAVLRDLRGQSLVLRYRDAEDDYLATEFAGQITQPALAERITLEASDLKSSVLNDEIPKGTITAALFPGAVDLGKPLLVGFGNMIDVPLYCVLDDRENDIFLYLMPRAIGDGALTITNLKRDGVGGEQFALIHPEEYEVLDAAAAEALAGVGPNVYPAWATFIHFFERQHRHGSNELHLLYGDISTPAADRNGSRIRRLALSSAWGLTQPVNAASFDAAVAIIDGLEDLHFDGVLGLNGGSEGTVRAGDFLRLLAMAADMWLTINEAGEWVEHVDTYTPAVQLALRDGPTEGVRNIAEIGPLIPRSTDEMIKDVVFKFRPRASGYIGEIRRRVPPPTSWGATHGQDLTIEHPYVNNAITAGKIVSRRVSRIRFTDQTIKVTGLTDARALNYGDVVTVTYAPRRLDGATFEIAGVTKHLSRFDLELQGGSANLYAEIYANEAGEIPDDLEIDPIVDYTRTAPDPATDMVLVSEIAYRNASGLDVGAARFGFTVPDENCSGYQFAWRKSGDSEWMKSGVVHKTGAVTHRHEPFITAFDYDVGVFTVNEPGNLSTEPSIEDEDMITGYQAARDTAAPTNPANLTAIAGTGSTIRLRWDAPPEFTATGDYDHTYVHLSTAGGADANFADLNATFIGRVRGTTFIHATATQGQQGWYRVRHEDYSGNITGINSSPTATATASGAAQGTAPSTPSAPTLNGSMTPYLNADGITRVFATFNIPAMPTGGAILQLLARQTVNPGEWVVLDEFVGDPGATFSPSRQDGGEPGQQLDIACRAYNAFGKPSAVSSVLTITLPGDTTVPGSPTAVTVRQKDTGVIEIDVTATVPADWGVTIVYRNTSNSTSGVTEIARGRALRFHDTSASYNTPYWYFAKVGDFTGNLSGFSPTSGSTHTITPAKLTGGGIAPQTVTGGGGSGNIAPTTVTTTERQVLGSDSGGYSMSAGSGANLEISHGLGRDDIIAIPISGSSQVVAIVTATDTTKVYLTIFNFSGSSASGTWRLDYM